MTESSSSSEDSSQRTVSAASDQTPGNADSTSNASSATERSRNISDLTNRHITSTSAGPERTISNLPQRSSSERVTSGSARRGCDIARRGSDVSCGSSSSRTSEGRIIQSSDKGSRRSAEEPSRRSALSFEDASRRTAQPCTELSVDRPPKSSSPREDSSSNRRPVNLSGRDPSRRARDRSRRASARHQSFMNRTLLHGPDNPSNYERRTTPQGQVYFVNKVTGQTTWHDPRLPRDTAFLSEQDLGALPEGWEVRYTASGRLYFVDHNTRTTQFTGKDCLKLCYLMKKLSQFTKNSPHFNERQVSLMCLSKM